MSTSLFIRHIIITMMCITLFACGGSGSPENSVSDTSISATNNPDNSNDNNPDNSSGGGSTNVTPVLNSGSVGFASRTVGVAPLGVFFNTNVNTQEFHEREYAWEFGDPSSDSWSTSGKSKNTDKGPVTAHVYEKPGIYTVNVTVLDGTGIIATDKIVITVQDPNLVYAGDKTICVSNTSANDFNGCPSDAVQFATDNIMDIGDYLGDDKRFLLHRGSRWSTNENFHIRGVDGVSVGAYGVGIDMDQQGLYANAPHIHLTDHNVTFFNIGDAEDWRFTELSLSGDGGSAIGGGTRGIDRALIYKTRVENMDSAVSIGHAATDGHDQVMVVDSHFSNAQGMLIYIGSERLVLQGNTIHDSQNTHLLRVWQAYQAVITHNIIYGSSLNNSRAGHALKIHGPMEDRLGPEGGNELAKRSEDILIANNVFGSSGPWPVQVGPQNGVSDERITNVIVEKNKFVTGLGDSYPGRTVEVHLSLHSRDTTARNNVFDDTGSTGSNYKAISVYRRGIEPAPDNIVALNNTVHLDPNTPYGAIKVFKISDEVTAAQVKNNLIDEPVSYGNLSIVFDESGSMEIENNKLTNSVEIDSGTPVPVWEDFNGDARPKGRTHDLGAFEK